MQMAALDVRPLAQQAHEALRKLILSGELSPGSPVAEDALAKRLGISRTPIREALRRLAEDGLVAAGDRLRARIATLSDAEADEVTEVRTALDALAAASCARRHAVIDLADLRRRATEIEALNAAGDVAEAFAADGAFHLALGVASGNRELVTHLTRLDGRVQLVRLTRCQDVARMTSNIARHHQLLAAIAAGDATAAANIARAHALDLP
jgi:DNA-binding GntR family transcriptional regulator